MVATTLLQISLVALLPVATSAFVDVHTDEQAHTYCRRGCGLSAQWSGCKSMREAEEQYGRHGVRDLPQSDYKRKEKEGESPCVVMLCTNQRAPCRAKKNNLMTSSRHWLPYHLTNPMLSLGTLTLNWDPVREMVTTGVMYKAHMKSPTMLEESYWHS